MRYVFHPEALAEYEAAALYYAERDPLVGQRFIAAVDWFLSMVDRKGFSVQIHPTGRNDFEASSDDARTMISLLLQRQRQKSGLSLAQAAQRLGAKSRNAYARYEQGVSVPTVEKLDKLLRAIAPDRDIVVRQSDAA